MKMRHDVDATTVRPKAKPLVGLALSLAILGGSVAAAVPVPPQAKMMHDCCGPFSKQVR